MLERFQTSTGVSSAQLAGGDGLWPQGGGEEGGNNRLPLRTVDTMDTNPLLVSPMEVQGVQQQVSLDTKISTQKIFCLGSLSFEAKKLVFL